MAKKALAIRHVSFEDLGILVPVLDAAGYEHSYFDIGTAEFDVVAPQAADLLIVLGGPISVYNTDQYPFLAEETAAVRQRIKAGKPTLGICFGHQIIAAALGASVGPGPGKEIGWGPVDLTDNGKNSVIGPLAGQSVLHWHGDVAAIPDGATRLAETDICRNQAFSIGRHVLALQFHIEADPARIEQWLIGHAVELAAAEVEPNRIRQDTNRYGLDTAMAGVMVFKRWIDGLAGEGDGG